MRVFWAIVVVGVVGVVGVVAYSSLTEPANLRVEELSVSRSGVIAGENVNVSVLVTNTGEKSGSRELQLMVDGDVESGKIVSVEGGGRKKVSFSVSRSVSDTYSVSVENESGSFEVVEPGEIEVVGLSVGQGRVEKGSSVRVDVGVKNSGGAPADTTVPLKVNGVVEKEKDVTVGPGDSDTVSFELEKGTGTYSVSSSGLTGSFEVVGPKPEVAVLDFNYPIIYSFQMDYIDRMIDHALEAENIEAAVLRINCPGGSASLIEDVYRHLEKLSSEKPVVTSIVGLAASGGYYISNASDHVYTGSSALVGNVGVLATSPTFTDPSERTVETGPYKRTGYSVKEFPLTMGSFLDDFVSAVEDGGDNALDIPRRKLISGRVYPGSRAVELGLADEVGSTGDAVEKAAEMAGVENYEMVEVRDVVSGPSWLATPGVNFGENGVSKVEGIDDWMSEFTVENLTDIRPSPSYYYLYLPRGSDLESGVDVLDENYGDAYSPPMPSGPENVGENEKKVVVDYAHLNAFDPSELEPLLEGLIREGSTYKLHRRGPFVTSLKDADALVVINPTMSYSYAETQDVKSFVESGGRVLFVNDPTDSGPYPINSLARNFCLSFGSGYLYNMENHYGIYRNIYVDNFQDRRLFKGVDRLALFTGTRVVSVAGGVAFTSPGTCFSTMEESGRFSTVAMGSDGNTVGVGDFSFMTRPWTTIEGNSEFLSSIIDYLIVE